MKGLQTKIIPTKQVWLNDGQIPRLPKNPRSIKDERFDRLVKSIQDDPEMLHLRECLVFPYAGEYVVIAGNMRLRACIEAGITEVPCKILPEDTPVEKLKAYTIKDNISFGQDDWDMLANEWDQDELTSWGMEVPIWNDGELESEDSEDNEGSGSGSIVKIVIEFGNLEEFNTAKEKLKELLEKDYPSANLIVK